MTRPIQRRVYERPTRPRFTTSYSAPTTISSEYWGLMSGSMGVLPAPTTVYFLSGDCGCPWLVYVRESWHVPVSWLLSSGLHVDALRTPLACGSLEPARSMMLSGTDW